MYMYMHLSVYIYMKIHVQRDINESAADKCRSPFEFEQGAADSWPLC